MIRLSVGAFAILALLANAGCIVSSDEGTEAEVGEAMQAASDGDNGVHYYLALGDSLSVGAQLQGPTNEGYVDVLYETLRQSDPKLKLVKLGCEGETTSTLIDEYYCTYPHGSQLDQAIAFLHAHKDKVALVTISIGGNDLGYCFGQDTSPTCIPDAFTSVATNLPYILSELNAAAGGDVPIVGMNYYNPFLVQWLSGPAGQQAAISTYYGLTVPYNSMISSIYAAAGSPVADVLGAFSTGDFTTIVQTPLGPLPLNVARICQWTYMCTHLNVHPNPAGYAVIAEAFAEVIPD